MKVQCYNPGCGQVFLEETNSPKSCICHKAMPVFQNGLKSWPCCQKTSWEWDEFMKFAGCSEAYHSSIKPASLIDKSKATPTAPHQLPNLIQEAIATSTFKELPKTNNIEETKKLIPQILPNGYAICSNKGCFKEFDPEENNEDCCIHHPGSPIFRDSKKYWSCCKQGSYDWDHFTKIIPCSKGHHTPKMVSSEQ